MGCASSKIDDLPAVVLCRQRLAFLDDALRLRYALAEAHVAYIESLKSVGASLHNFFDAAEIHSSSNPILSPVLNLPPRRKGDSDEPGSFPSGGFLSHSNSGSHLHFHSDSDDENSGSESLHHLYSPSPLSHRDDIYEGHEILNPHLGVYMHMNYMKKQATPPVSYERRPLSPEKVQMEESTFYHPYYYSNYENSNSNYYDYSNGYINYGGGGGGGGRMGGFFGSSPPPAFDTLARQAGAALSSSSKLPPSPPPPITSAWDFLNPFETIETNYPPYTPSRDSREVREEEGMPDLEDEDDQRGIVKEVHGDEKLVDVIGTGGKNSPRGAEEEEEDIGVSDGVAHYSTTPSSLVENDLVKFAVHVADEKIVGEEGGSEEPGTVGSFKGRSGLRNVADVVKEIHVQFQRASSSGSELAKMLEVGKLPYQRKNAASQVSSKMLHAITPSLPSTSKDIDVLSTAMDLDEDVRLGSGNLSSTLQKLYLWEKKLLEEVKAEEKLRVIHDNKLQKLRRLDERGAEAHKVDSTRTLVRSLSPKIKMAIQVVDKISVKINKLRDDELWPQLNELIRGLARMWKAMLECHDSQCQAVDGVKGLDAIAFPENPSDAHLKATMQLEHDLINWALRFSSWIGAQKGYVRALNSWLLKCLLYEPEETADGIAPFSPGRVGAPPVFVICNQWSQGLERTSEKEVIDSMRAFATTVFGFWERDKVQMQQRMMASKEMERKAKNLEREDLKLRKEIQALDKKTATLSGNGNGLVVYQSDTSSNSNLHNGLQRVFEAMNRFTAESVKAYEELLRRSEEVIQEHGRV